MNKVYTIEARFDTVDPDKHIAVAQLCGVFAKRLQAQLDVLKDHQTPTVTVYSHDRENGHVDIAAVDVTTPPNTPKAVVDDETQALMEGLRA